jgi:hypothetical protein
MYRHWSIDGEREGVREIGEVLSWYVGLIGSELLGRYESNGVEVVIFEGGYISVLEEEGRVYIDIVSSEDICYGDLLMELGVGEYRIKVRERR